MTRWLAVVVLLAGCAARRELPALPAAELPAGAQAAVREAVGAALSAAKVRPEDSAAVARLGMVLHAHGELGGAAQAEARAVALARGEADYAYYRGVALAGLGQYAEAVEPLRAALGIRETAAGRLRLGDALYGAGRVDEARREYERVVAADAGLAAGHYGLGRCLEGQAAVAALRRAVELYPRYGAARFALAGVLRKMGRGPEAEALLVDYERDKLAAPPVADPAMAAVEALDASAAGMLRAAQGLDRAGRGPEALAMLERAVAVDGKLGQAWVTLIALYARAGRPDRAEEAYRKALELDARNAEAHYNYGVMMAQAERVAEARGAFAKAVEADPRHAEALDGLGAMVEMTGALEQAAQLYRRALAVKPGLRLARFHLGRILANQRRYAEAIGELEKAVEPVDGQAVGFLYALGATQARAGQRAEAVSTLRRAREAAERFGDREMAAAIGRDLGRLGDR